MDPEGEIETRCSECECSMLATLREVMLPFPIFCSVDCEADWMADEVCGEHGEWPRPALTYREPGEAR